MTVEDFDLIVVGAGNAFALAVEAARRGKRVALIEDGPLGGTCPNRGCIPTKLLLAHADVARTVREAERFHVHAHLEGVDGNAIVGDVRRATQPTDGKLEGALPDGVTLVRARGRFVGRRTLEAGGRALRGDRVVVATGSRPRPPSDPGVEGTPAWSSRDVFERMDALPRSIAIVGGGYIGVEMAHFFHGVGVDTVLLHRGERLLEASDTSISKAFTEAFVERIPTRLGTTVRQVGYEQKDDDGRGAFAIEVEDARGRAEPVQAEALLYAIGRLPNTHDLGLETAGIETDDRGFIRVDDHLATTAEGVYALGDVNGRYMFTHTASYEARYLTRVLFDGHQAAIHYGPVPHAVFSAPEVAGVGETQDALDRAGRPYEVAELPYTTAAKGRAIKERHGRCKILVAPDGELLGCHLVGEHASILLHEVIPAMRWRPSITSLTEIIHVHPALPEIIRNTARAAAQKLDLW